MPRRSSHTETTFAHAFQISRKAGDDWFDPKLHTDTDLFVDPFLMFEESDPPWNAVHDRLIDFFNTALEHVAKAARNRRSVEWTRAAAMLSFPEPPEFCLGYGKKTIFGAGSAEGLGNDMLGAAQQAIDAGLTNINDFGELLIFGAGMGADRISDLVCNVVKDDFVRYTSAVATRHGLPTEQFSVEHNGFDFAHDRWRRARLQLPRNPCWTKKTAVLLAPARFLDELPKMEDGEFWDWVYDNQNEQLRHDLGYTITQGLNKKQIITLARRRITIRQKFGIRYADANRQHPPKPYDLDRDPDFKVTALEAGQAVSAKARISAPATEAEFCQFVRDLTTEFKWAVEERGIWRSFWSGGVPRQEPRAQEIFHVAVLMTCKLHDVDVSPESDAGQGPVDFKFSSGWKRRALVELKFAKSSTFWDNLEQQTPAYLKAEGISCGYIVVIQHDQAHKQQAFIDRVNATVGRISVEVGWKCEAVFVDVTPRLSASKLRRPKPET